MLEIGVADISSTELHNMKAESCIISSKYYHWLTDMCSTIGCAEKPVLFIGFVAKTHNDYDAIVSYTPLCRKHFNQIVIEQYKEEG